MSQLRHENTGAHLMAARRLSILLVVLAVVGCARRPYYGLEVLNRTGQECREIVIEFGGLLEEFPPHTLNGHVGTSAYFPNPSPSEATIRWTTESGERHVKTLKLKSLKGADLDKVDYVFVIRYDGSADAAPFTHDEKVAGLDAQFACAGRPAYMVGIKNLTDAKLTDVVVRFGDFQVNGGGHVEGPKYNDGWSFFGGLPYPVTDSAHIHWKTAGGIDHSCEVALMPELPADLNGVCICFLLGNAQNASMRAVPFEELRAGRYPDLHRGWKVSSKTK